MMAYWIFRDKRDGRQVEWSDEWGEWFHPGANQPIDDRRNHANIEMVRVTATDDVRPITDAEGCPRELYEAFPE
jgi:hypothetical protein